MPVSTLIRAVPMWDIKLMSAFLSVEPSPEDRVEHAIAQLTSMWVHSKKTGNAEYEPPAHFLMYRKAWDRDAELDSNDLGVMNVLHRKPQ